MTSRELDGKLYAGHETFEWLLAVISYVMAAEVGSSARSLLVAAISAGHTLLKHHGLESQSGNSKHVGLPGWHVQVAAKQLAGAW